MTEMTQEELGRMFLAKLMRLSTLAAVRDSSNMSRSMEQYYCRKLARYFMRANYTVVVERIRESAYPVAFLREKVLQLDEFLQNPTKIPPVFIKDVHAESVFDVESFYR